MESEGNKLFEDALSLLEERRFFEAVDAFSRLVALSPDMTGAYGNRGLAYLNLGLDDEARTDFETVLQLDPDDAMGHSMLAEVGRFYDAPETTLAHVAEALELNPDEAQAHFIRGWLFARAGQFDMAVEDLTRFLELAGENDDIRDFLEACEILASDQPPDTGGKCMSRADWADEVLGLRGWSFNPAENPYWEEQGLPCAFAHCIRNRPPLAPEAPGGCPVFGYSCPGMQEQVSWCREHPKLFD